MSEHRSVLEIRRTIATASIWWSKGCRGDLQWNVMVITGMARIVMSMTWLGSATLNGLAGCLFGFAAVIFIGVRNLQCSLFGMSWKD
ncbi:hypothetical protein D3C84_1106370 [compost metagenome]